MTFSVVSATTALAASHSASAAMDLAEINMETKKIQPALYSLFISVYSLT